MKLCVYLLEAMVHRFGEIVQLRSVMILGLNQVRDNPFNLIVPQVSQLASQQFKALLKLGF